MLVPESKIIVCCSMGTSGGPELLHQLVHELRSNGREAHICYYPFETPFKCPSEYRKYDAPQIQLTDDPNTFILVPETATWIAKNVNDARVGIWWLSVDNYFLAKHNSKIKDLYLRYKSLIRARLPIFRVRHLLHFSQSYYAEKFLQKFSIKSHRLTDYLSEEHFANHFSGEGCEKENIIAYNPLKGYKKTQLLINKYPEIDFIPIQNMTSREVAKLLGRAKIYIDFGHHPGKDRPPREAAMAGCCIITGRSGSAQYHDDLSILEKYKLDDTTVAYIHDFGILSEQIFENFSSHAQEFDGYRLKILNEPEVFKQQVRSIFG